MKDPITFASVHDSYWTHPCDVEKLRDVLKEQFVRLHSQPILEDLRKEFLERYRGRKVLKIEPVNRQSTEENVAVTDMPNRLPIRVKKDLRLLIQMPPPQPLPKFMEKQAKCGPTRNLFDDGWISNFRRSLNAEISRLKK
jgi:DNA-directed RNA polymerase